MIKNHLWRAGAVLAVTSLSLFGCSDDDDDNTNGTGGMGGVATGGTGGSGGNGAGGATGGAPSGGMGGMGGMTQQDVIDTVTAAGTFTTLLGLLEQAELTDTLRGAGPFTVFAPTDDAFDQFESDNPGVLEGLSDAELSNVLRYHVVEGTVLAADLSDGDDVETLADDDATFTVNANGDVTLTDGSDDTDDATVTEADIEASNGVIHVVDAVLLPPTAD